jgi:hypothetical protein
MGEIGENGLESVDEWVNSPMTVRFREIMTDLLKKDYDCTVEELESFKQSILNSTSDSDDNLLAQRQRQFIQNPEALKLQYNATRRTQEALE